MEFLKSMRFYLRLSQESSEPVDAVNLTGELPAEIASSESLGIKSVIAVKVIFFSSF